MITTTDNLTNFKALSNDKVDWKMMGDDLDIIEVHEGTNVGKSQKGVGFEVTSPQQCAFRTQGSGLSWPGNFKPNAKGMRLMFTDDQQGPITIVFALPIKGVGVQIQELFGIELPGGAPFNANIKAFKKGQSMPIAELNVHGWSDNGADQASFLGCIADVAVIDYVKFNTTSLIQGDKGDFAIGTVFLIV